MADRYIEFQLGWWADPVFFGKYPDSMVQVRSHRNAKQGRNTQFAAEGYSPNFVVSV